MGQLFTHEVLWYEFLCPSLTKVHPELKEMSPPCLFSHCTNLVSRVKSPTLQKALGIIFSRIFTKAERGIIVLENMSLESTTISNEKLMKGRDKREVMDIDEAKGAMVTLGTFHGILWNFYRGHSLPKVENKEQNVSISREELISYLSVASKIDRILIRKLILKNAKDVLKPVNLMIQNYFPDQGHLLQKIENFQAKRLHEVIDDYFDTSKRYFGIGHNDLDTRNMLVNKQKNKVMLIDFQSIAPSHLSQDFWHLIYTCTDRHFRQNHLDTCFETYFETLKKYVGPKIPDMTLSGLKEEFQSMRLYEALVRAPGFFAVMLNPVQMEELTPNNFKEKLDELGRVSFKIEDEKMMDLRRRVLEVFTEVSDLNLI